MLGTGGFGDDVGCARRGLRGSVFCMTVRVFFGDQLLQSSGLDSVLQRLPPHILYLCIQLLVEHILGFFDNYDV